MKSKNLLFPVIVAVITVIAVNVVQAQKVMVHKKVETVTKNENPDSSTIVTKTITTVHSDGSGEEMNVDSLIKDLSIEKDSKEMKMVKIITIQNGDTVIKESHSANFDTSLVSELDPEMMNVEFHYEMRDMEGSELHNFIISEDELDKEMIFISEDGEDIKIEKNGEFVFIERPEDMDPMESDIQIMKNKDGKKVIMHKSTMLMEELTESEKSDLKTKGITISKNEPEFDYLKIQPNPSQGFVNIEFKTAKPVDTEVKVIASKGNILYEEKLNQLTGEYKKLVNLRPYGKGTYFVLIGQGKKNISRKIIVD